MLSGDGVICGSASQCDKSDCLIPDSLHRFHNSSVLCFTRRTISERLRLCSSDRFIGSARSVGEVKPFVGVSLNDGQIPRVTEERGSLLEEDNPSELARERRPSECALRSRLPLSLNRHRFFDGADPMLSAARASLTCVESYGGLVIDVAS